MAGLTDNLSVAMSGRETEQPVKRGPSIFEGLIKVGTTIQDALEGASDTRSRAAQAARQAAADARQRRLDARADFENSIEDENRNASNFVANGMLGLSQERFAEPEKVSETDTAAIAEGGSVGQQAQNLQRAVQQGRMSEDAYQLKVGALLRAAFTKFPNSQAFIFKQVDEMGINHPLLTPWKRAAEAVTAEENSTRKLEEEAIEWATTKGGYSPDEHDRPKLVELGRQGMHADYILEKTRTQYRFEREQVGENREDIDRVEKARSQGLVTWLETSLGPLLQENVGVLTAAATDERVPVADRIKMVGPAINAFTTKGRAFVDLQISKAIVEGLSPEDAEQARKRAYANIDEATRMFSPSNPTNIMALEANTLKAIQTKAGLRAEEALPLYSQLRRTLGNDENLQGLVDTIFQNPKTAAALAREMRGFQGLSDGDQTVRLKNALAIISDEHTQLRDLTPEQGRQALKDSTTHLRKIIPVAVKGTNANVTKAALNVVGKIANAAIDLGPGTDLNSLVAASQHVASNMNRALIETGLRLPETRELTELVVDSSRAVAQKNLIALAGIKTGDPYWKTTLDIGAGKYVLQPTGVRPVGPGPATGGMLLGRRAPGSTGAPSQQTVDRLNALNRNIEFLRRTTQFEDKSPLSGLSQAELTKFYGTGVLPASATRGEAAAPSFQENLAKFQRFWEEQNPNWDEVEAVDPQDVVDRIMGAETGGTKNPNTAKNPNSSATGAGQFIKSTWIDMVKRHRPDLAEGKSKEEILALRSDGALSKAMTRAYAQENGQRLSAEGIPATPTNTYLAHFAGPADAVKVLKAPDDTPLEGLIDSASIAANRFLKGKTVRWLKNWAKEKMNA